jgi:hypothetical protein
MLTCIAIFLTFTAFGLWLCLTCELYPGVIAPQFFILTVIMTFFVYMVERQMKSEFL